jgi:hypothetical protein
VVLLTAPPLSPQQVLQVLDHCLQLLRPAGDIVVLLVQTNLVHNTTPPGNMYCLSEVRCYQCLLKAINVLACPHVHARPRL